MSFTPIAAASAIALGALLGGLTVSSGANALGSVQQHTAAFAPSTDVAVPGTGDNNGNG